MSNKQIRFNALPSNPVCNTFKALLKRKDKNNEHRLFFGINNNIRQAILNDRVNIIANKTIDFNKLLEEEKISKKEFEYILNMNKNTIINGRYTVDGEGMFFNVIVKLNMTISEDGTISSVQDTDEVISSRQGKPAKSFYATRYTPPDEDEDKVFLLPKYNFDYSSLILNFFKFSNKVRYVFMKNFDIMKISDNFPNLQQNELEITGAREYIEIPIRYEVTCTHNTSSNIECGNIVVFSDMHKHSRICCTDSMNGIFDKESKHIIKNLEKASVAETAILYLYSARDLLEPAQKNEFMLASLTPIKDTYIKTNGFLKNAEQTTILYVISHRPIEQDKKELAAPILMKSKKSAFFLHDIVSSIQKYYKDYHNILVNNSNRIVAEVIIFQLLTNLYFDYNFKALVLGTSGSGKTWWAKILSPLFTNRYKILQGESLTRNRYLGGRSNIMSKLYNSSFSAGYIATNDFLFVEETAEQLEKFHDPRHTDVGNNIFSMDKRIGNKNTLYDVGIQGSTETFVKATTFLTGNIESMNAIVKQYTKELYKSYRKITSGSSLPSNQPKFKQIEFYVKKTNNLNLAKAHLSVRKRKYWKRNYITALPQAEQARKEIFIALEEDGFFRPELGKINTEKISSIQPHREEFLKELEKIFGDKKEIPEKFKNDIKNFLNSEFFYKKRNNFCRNKHDVVNNHVIVAQTNLCIFLVYMQKLYFNQSIEFKDEDKNLINYFESFNYNTLSSKEASMFKKPFINDFFLDSDRVDIEIDKAEEEYNLKALIDKKADEKLKMKLDKNVLDESLKITKENKDDEFDENG